MNDWNNTWYSPGDWALPAWWTSGVPMRSGRATTADQRHFMNGPFVRNVLGHTGGMTVLPATTRRNA